VLDVLFWRSAEGFPCSLGVLLLSIFGHEDSGSGSGLIWNAGSATLEKRCFGSRSRSRQAKIAPLKKETIKNLIKKFPLLVFFVIKIPGLDSDPVRIRIQQQPWAGSGSLYYKKHGFGTGSETLEKSNKNVTMIPKVIETVLPTSPMIRWYLYLPPIFTLHLQYQTVYGIKKEARCIVHVVYSDLRFELQD